MRNANVHAITTTLLKLYVFIEQEFSVRKVKSHKKNRLNTFNPLQSAHLRHSSHFYRVIMAHEEKYDQPLAPSRRLTLHSVKIYIEIKSK